MASRENKNLPATQEETPEQELLRLRQLCASQAALIGDYTRNIEQLRALVDTEQFGRQKEAEKRRNREQSLLNEIRMLGKGIHSGCPCPAGQCFKVATPGQLCWAKWAGLTAVRDVAQRAIDDALRAAVHPSRMNEKPQQPILPAGDTNET